MNKKEQAYVEELKTKLALRWTNPVTADVPPPSHNLPGNVLSVGFLPLGELSDYGRVEPACSSSCYHGAGRQDKTSTQNPRSLYSSRLLALKALRYATEERCAKLLRRVDQMIEAEEGKET